jgi:hypothetical protein
MQKPLLTKLRPPATAPGPSLESVRLPLADGAATTLRVARFDRSRFVARVVEMEPRATLLRWCAKSGAEHAMIGGFYVRPEGTPLGEVQIAGRARRSVPFDPPWGELRACIHVDGGEVALASRREISAEPGGDLLQAGPMLAAGGVSLIRPGRDPEGFSTGSHQFDSDLTVGRYPRAALGLGERELIAVVCEGRAKDEAGLSLGELADAMLGLGAAEAINLDGGGSASLVVGGRLCNTPREQHGREVVGGRKLATAIQFAQR